MQSEEAVSAPFTIKQILPFGLAEQNSEVNIIRLSVQERDGRNVLQLAAQVIHWYIVHANGGGGLWVGKKK